MLRILLTLAVLTLTAPAASQECPGDSVCVAGDDLVQMLTVLKERQCLDQTTPTLTMDPILIITDEDGRVYYSGDDPIPYTLNLDWCNYHIKAQGQVKATVSKKIPRTWGFRFRPKAHLGFLPLRPLSNDLNAADGIEAGLAADFLYYKFVNLNVYAGFRSVGVGPGLDITKNFGGMVAYSLSYTNPYHGFYAGLYFAF